MAADALEEKINKIRQQNEEIKRRHEEVEEDKKNAAKLNALVQMVPSTDWPERKEPPEFFNPPRINNKSKPAKEHHEHSQQYYPTSGEGRKIHTFAQGQGPPPDPKYNFLADSEREEGSIENVKDNSSSRGQKYSRGTFKKKLNGKDGTQRHDYKTSRGLHKDEHQPEYEAWRAERNRIDEDRISRQRTAEGNWRREWDNDKAHIVDNTVGLEAKLGDYVKRDHKDFDRRYHINGHEYANHNRGGNQRSYRSTTRHFHNNYENRSNNAYHHDGHLKNPLPSNSEERTVTATDKSIKVTLNPGSITKGPVMSVKVNSPNIAGTGRVGPRQMSRVTYSSHSDIEVTSPESESFSRPKSFEDKSKSIYHDNHQKFSNSRKSHSQSKKSVNNKSPYLRKKEVSNENPQKYFDTGLKYSYIQKEPQKCHQPKAVKLEESNIKLLQNDLIDTVEKESNALVCNKSNIKDIKDKDEDQKDDLNSYLNSIEKDEVCTNIESESHLQNVNLSAHEITTEIESYSSFAIESKPDDEIVQEIVLSECETIKTDLIAPIMKDMDDNNKNSEANSIGNSLCDFNNTDKVVIDNKGQNLPKEQIKKIVSNNCDSEQNQDVSKQKNGSKHDINSSEEEQQDEVCEIVIPFANDVHLDVHTIEQNYDKATKQEETLIVEDEIITAATLINTDDKQAICANETHKRTDENSDATNDAANDAANDVVDKIESPEENIQVEKDKTVSNEITKTEK